MPRLGESTQQSFQDAIDQLRRVGCANAQGDALAAMYAQIAQQTLALSPRMQEKIFAHMKSQSDMGSEIKHLLRDPFAIFEVI